MTSFGQLCTWERRFSGLYLLEVMESTVLEFDVGCCRCRRCHNLDGCSFFRDAFYCSS